MLKKLILPIILLTLAFGFWVSGDFQTIAAGVAVFLFGMLMMEDGFKQFSGGVLENILEKATRTIPRALSFGFVTTTIVQSSSLVSVIAISFLSAGLISLKSGVVIVLGADIGTTTGAWLVAGFGLKVNIAKYALPMLAVAIVLVFQKHRLLKGIGYILAGIGFLFLGISYMKEGFDAFSGQFDLSRYAMTGFAGLLVYTALGAVATVVMQSSHATMVLTITALSAGQVSYENALALTIGANIGTTITAILGAISANYQGKRLALSHVMFKLLTAAFTILLIGQFETVVDLISRTVGIADDDYTLKLAVFHTLFNTFGVVLILPVLAPYVGFLRRAIQEPVEDLSKPKFLTPEVEEYPQAIPLAMRNETMHLYENAVELIAHGLNLHRHELFQSKDIAATVEASLRPVEFDIDERYEARIKTLYAAIIDFSTRVTMTDAPKAVVDEVYAMRDVSERIVRAVKAVKHLRRNTTLYTSRDQGLITDLYNELRTEIARILVEIRKLDLADPEDRSGLWLDQERLQVESDSQDTNKKIEALIRNRQIDARMATSFLNDSDYAYTAMRALLAAARAYYIETEDAVAEVEKILAMEDEDIEDALRDFVATDEEGEKA